jgi:transketolase
MSADSKETRRLEELAKLERYYLLNATTRAGSGHPTSALSATDLMTALLFGGVFRYDPEQPEHPNNDRLIFSKGHASPLSYALWLATGKISADEMMTYRVFGSPWEGTPPWPLPTRRPLRAPWGRACLSVLEWP